MVSSNHPVPFFRPSCARAAEYTWGSRKTIVRMVPHTAIRWIKNFFFLRPFDGVRAFLPSLEWKEETSHGNSAWRVLETPCGQALHPALSERRQKEDSPVASDSSPLWVPQELSSAIQPQPGHVEQCNLLQPLRVEES
jgi:hypothetical protein